MFGKFANVRILWQYVLITFGDCKDQSPNLKALTEEYWCCDSWYINRKWFDILPELDSFLYDDDDDDNGDDDDDNYDDGDHDDNYGEYDGDNDDMDHLMQL